MQVKLLGSLWNSELTEAIEAGKVVTGYAHSKDEPFIREQEEDLLINMIQIDGQNWDGCINNNKIQRWQVAYNGSVEKI